MDRQEYLNQISAKNRPAKSGGKFAQIISSKFFLIGVIAVALFILMAIIGGALSGGKGNDKERTFALKLHLDNTAEVINNYQKSVKSSDLRSSSASLYSVLSNTNRDLTTYITDKYGYKESNVPKGIAEEATLSKDGLEADLFEAKINGILDRIFAHKMAYEISVIASEEANIINSTSSAELKEMLTTSYNSLNNLHNAFNDFSEAK